jgi:two-component system, sensor histidine kinase and response regulator
VTAAAERVLVLCPTGRDAEMVRERIEAEGMVCEVCADLETLLASMSSEAGVAVIAQEAMSTRGAQGLLAALEAQEPWSDIPVLLLAATRSQRRIRVAAALFERANVTLLQRPLDTGLFLSSVHSAIRARRRQYQMRELHRDVERAVQLSDTFVAILGHDLRNPLGAIRFASELIVRLSSDERSLRPAGRILAAADRMARMIEQLLDLARVRKGDGIPLHVAKVHLGEICRQAVEELEDANPQASLIVQETGNLVGLWDADRLAQLVSNLAGNAVQHGTGARPIVVELDGTHASLMCLRVRSSGTIPPDALPTIFEAFKRTVATTPFSGQRRGLGLGLFIAREIARAHGGDIVVESSEDETTFAVTLRREAPVHDPRSGDRREA